MSAATFLSVCFFYSCENGRRQRAQCPVSAAEKCAASIAAENCTSCRKSFGSMCDRAIEAHVSYPFSPPFTCYNSSLFSTCRNGCCKDNINYQFHQIFSEVFFLSWISATKIIMPVASGTIKPLPSQ